MIPILASVACMTKPLISVLLTEKWLPCVPFLVIYCILRMFGPILNIDKQVYYALGKSGINLYYEIGLFVCNFITLFIAIQINVMAIAVGALIVEVVGSVIIFVVSSRIYAYTLKERCFDLWKPVVGTIVMSIAMIGVGLVGLSNIETLGLQIIVGALVYYLMTKITKDDNLSYCITIAKDVIKKK